MQLNRKVNGPSASYDLGHRNRRQLQFVALKTLVLDGIGITGNTMLDPMGNVGNTDIGSVHRMYTSIVDFYRQALDIQGDQTHCATDYCSQ